MLIAIDASAVLAVLLNEPTKPAVITAAGRADLIAPASLDIEIANAFSRMFKRRSLTLEQADEALRGLASIVIRREKPLVNRAIQLSSQLDIYAYDALMICTAEQFGCPLLTLDGGLAYAARRVGIETIEV